MKRTTIMLPDELLFRAQQQARISNSSMAELIRKSLEKTLNEEQKKWKEDSFFADKAVWKGRAPKDLSTNIDKYLYDDDRP
jgi:predicted transcriptional regulator